MYQDTHVVLALLRLLRAGNDEPSLRRRFRCREGRNFIVVGVIGRNDASITNSGVLEKDLQHFGVRTLDEVFVVLEYQFDFAV